MKILYVITGLGMGGAERVTADLADQMYQRGHQVKIAYLTGDVIVRPISQDIELIYLNLNKLKDFFSASQQYRKLIKQYQPDVVHAHMVHANLFSRLNRIFCKVPKLICTAHNSNEGGYLRMLGYKFTNMLSDFNSNVSKEATESLIQKGAFNKYNLKTIYNGIDLSKFKPIENVFLKNSLFNRDEINLLSVGRLNEQKDYPNLIHAVAKVKMRTSLPIKFYISGEGKLRPQLENLISQFDLTNDIILLGNRTDIPSLLNEANFFILCSKYEGLPTVLIEAMACQNFAIATNCGGSAEIMGDTGILVKPQDSEKLAQAILKALSLSSEQIQENNLKARKRIEKLFSLEKSVETWLSIYEN